MMLSYGKRTANNALLFLHGYGQSAQNARLLLSQTVSFSTLRDLSLVCFFPNDDWFSYIDENSLDYNQESLHNTRKYVHEQINLLLDAYDKVILMGYSQGASVALDAALTFPQVLIPVVAISGMLLVESVVSPGESYSQINDVYIAHGTEDPEISLKLANKSFQHTSISQSCYFCGTHWDFWSYTDFSNFILDSLKQIFVVNSRAVAQFSQQK